MRIVAKSIHTARGAYRAAAFAFVVIGLCGCAARATVNHKKGDVVASNLTRQAEGLAGTFRKITGTSLRVDRPIAIGGFPSFVPLTPSSAASKKFGHFRLSLYADSGTAAFMLPAKVSRGVRWEERFPELGLGRHQWAGYELFGSLRLTWFSDTPHVSPAIAELAGILRDVHRG